MPEIYPDEVINLCSGLMNALYKWVEALYTPIADAHGKSLNCAQWSGQAKDIALQLLPAADAWGEDDAARALRLLCNNQLGPDLAYANQGGNWEAARNQYIQPVIDACGVLSARAGCELAKANRRKLEAAASGDAAPAHAAAEPKRRGRMPKAESDAKRALMLAQIRQHASMKDDVGQLANMVGVSESTARRWLDDEERRYRESKAANPDPAEE